MDIPMMMQMTENDKENNINTTLLYGHVATDRWGRQTTDLAQQLILSLSLSLSLSRACSLSLSLSPLYITIDLPTA